MTNRKILYGYQIVHGDLVIQEEERLTVQNVFTTYLAGLSYQALADRMNADNIPFSQESPLWNKHKIKRMLENSRYAGENGYPSIIDQDTFQQVQNKIADKASGKLPRRTESDGLGRKLKQLAHKVDHIPVLPAGEAIVMIVCHIQTGMSVVVKRAEGHAVAVDFHAVQLRCLPAAYAVFDNFKKIHCSSISAQKTAACPLRGKPPVASYLIKSPTWFHLRRCYGSSI